jgi:DMSO/TMAO reductase YedYZ molybdopterin-dependent catalytic subunit
MRREPVLWGRGFVAGAAGGVAAVVALFAYRAATGMPTLQEALAERLIRLMPYQVFAFLLDRLQHLAKPLGLLLAIIVLVIGFGGGGMLYARVTRASRQPWFALGLLTAGIAWLFLTFAFLPFIEGGILGVPLTTVVTAPALPMAVASLLYGLVLAVVYGRSSARRVSAGGRGLRTPPVVLHDRPRAEDVAAKPAAGTFNRRDVLRRSGLVLVAAAAGARVVAWAGEAGSRAAGAAMQAFQLLKGMPPEVTPDNAFYQVSKNFFDPTVNVARWSLEVTGLVDKPLKLSLGDLQKAAPAVERYQTFECISNEVGGDLIGNAKWTGVRVKDLLAQAQVRPGATTIIWHAADGYTESIPLPVAMEPESLLAYAMNDQPIPQKHGAPVRVLLLNRYGMKQPKWLTGIEVANHDYTGYWELQGWSKTAIVKTNSAFRVEMRDNGVVALGGWAFAGSRGISRVEISADGRKTWFQAAVKQPLGVNCWQFWSAEWKPPAPGDYAFEVRAVDGAGNVQPAGPKPTLPDGAEGYHTVHVRV